LVHVFAGDRLWLTRFQRAQLGQFTSESDYRITVLQSEWPEVYRGWDELLQGWKDEDVRADFTYQDLHGNVWTQKAWHLMMHVVNHGTHHRGQVAGFLRTMGHTPPALDLHAYYRQC
jgi:uncharacterized damage-inducible protein DinB